MNQKGIMALVARVEGGPYYTITQVAEMIGKSTDTIRRWVKEGSVPAPTNKMNLGEEGNSFVWLYTKEDVEMMAAYATIVQRGRPRKRAS